MGNTSYKDWGEISPIFQEIWDSALNKNLESDSEAQTRFDVIDRLIREVLQWKFGQIVVEEHTESGYIDYLLISGDKKIVIEAKKGNSAFPSPTNAKKLKLGGPVLGQGPISIAIQQAERYANDKNADIVIVTNGSCWCFYPFGVADRKNYFASLLYPFKKSEDGEQLFKLFACQNVENGSIETYYHLDATILENRLIEVVKSDIRVERNNIADYIAPALDYAINGEAMFDDSEKLSWCFVSSDSRTKFDNSLNIYLSDSKPTSILPARRIRKSSQDGEFEKLVKVGRPSTLHPVTLLIGSVGVGKSTYLKHFELVKGKSTLSGSKSHWIYIDFEQMGKSGNPRKFIYNQLKDYLLRNHPGNPTDYKTVIEPAYEDEIAALARGPYSLIFNDKELFNKKIFELIEKDFLEVEPYVDKIFKYISANELCVIVLDNIDLYEDDSLEISVFSEGIALSKKYRCHVIASIRDTTYVKHKDDSIFNAYELKRLWLDPPPFKEVLSKRLTYAKQILHKRKAVIDMPNSFRLNIPDLSVFFEIVQISILDGRGGQLIEALSGRNVRRGLNLVSNFLTSGHVRADVAIRRYLDQNHMLPFSYQEVFSGAILGQWKLYKEGRAEAYNIYDARFGAANLLLLRLYILKMLFHRAKNATTLDTAVSQLISIFSTVGASENHICDTLNSIRGAGLIKSADADIITNESIVNITFTGGYYLNSLSMDAIYLDSIVNDTSIFDDDTWKNICNITDDIDAEHSSLTILELRQKRVLKFIDYLKKLEESFLGNFLDSTYLRHMNLCFETVERQTREIIDSVSRANNRRG